MVFRGTFVRWGRAAGCRERVVAGETGKRGRRGLPGSAWAVNHHGGSRKAAAPRSARSGWAGRGHRHGQPLPMAATGQGRKDGGQCWQQGRGTPALLGDAAAHPQAAGHRTSTSVELGPLSWISTPAKHRYLKSLPKPSQTR